MSKSKENTLHMIGNAHIDPVWLWNWQEGFQEVKATFRSALDRMKEDKEFIFSSSSSVFYEWVEQNNPAMFREIQERIQEGRWEVVGGWYLQPDCNIPSGESLVRQGLYAQRYFLEKLGVKAQTGYNVDSFGHNGMLPQILAKSGLKNYVFMRPMPLEKGLPGRIFWWESPDGSRVLTYRIPYEYCTWGKDLERYVNRLLLEFESGEKELMMFYGVGNHGGGPTRENLRSIHELNRSEEMPKLQMSTTSTFFDNMRKSGKVFPGVEGDLQHHASGCYSVHSGVKKANRLSENLLLKAEKWSSIAQVLELQPYPSDFKQGWKGILFNQFHDILAGTSIPSAYDDASYLYGEAMAIGQRNLNYALQALSWAIDIEEDTSMRPIVVFNSQGVSGKAVVELEVRGLSGDNFILKNHLGQIVPAQRITSEATVGGQSRLLFVAELPSLGYSVYKLYLNQDPEAISVDAAVTVRKDLLENEFLTASFDQEKGWIKSLFDKVNEVEVLKRPSAKLTIREDSGDTWSHNIYSFNQMVGDMECTKVRILEEGPVRSTLRFTYNYEDSIIWQDFHLYKEFDHLETTVTIDWRSPRKIVKLGFSPWLNFRKPTYEIPFGYIEKSANGEEEPGQNWIDFSGEHMRAGKMYGLSLANDSKYSYSFEVDEMTMTLVKNSVFAHHDPTELEANKDYQYVDHGRQTLKYLLLPHGGSWKTSKIIDRSNFLNQPVVSVIETYHAGTLPQSQSFFSVDSPHIKLTALKAAEDGDGIILRAYETIHQPVKANFDLGLMGRSFSADFSPCEIKTFKIPYDGSKAVEEVNLIEWSMEE